MEKIKEKEFKLNKEEDFSNWFSEIIQKSELLDLRYNIKGFNIFKPWAVEIIEKMYDHMQKILKQKNHKPYYFPTLIPEQNFKLESGHLKGFTPEVFWVKEAGTSKLPEKLALRPTSETAFYQMFALWIRSYKDLPFKTYQRANIFRYDTKATRPLLRDREFYWIETHCAHTSKENALNQVKEDMETTEQVLHGIFGLPFIFFERPEWDKFAGAERTFAADVLNPDGKLVQQPSTHLINASFAKAFNITYKDKNQKQQPCYLTCYGPAMSRILASIIIIHGDNKGLRLPWKIAPKQVVIVPIKNSPEILKKVEKIKQELETKDIEVEVDLSEKTTGEKFYFWEMKGVPARIEIGLKEIENKELTIFRRDLNKKEKIKEKDLIKYIQEFSTQYDKNLTKQSDNLFNNRIIDVDSKSELKKAIEQGKIARCNFCSVEKKAMNCAEIIEKEINAEVRGTKFEKETPLKDSKCVICKKPAKEIVYIARAY